MLYREVDPLVDHLYKKIKFARCPPMIQCGSWKLNAEHIIMLSLVSLVNIPIVEKKYTKMYLKYIYIFTFMYLIKIPCSCTSGILKVC